MYVNLNCGKYITYRIVSYRIGTVGAGCCLYAHLISNSINKLLAQRLYFLIYIICQVLVFPHAVKYFNTKE